MDWEKLLSQGIDAASKVTQARLQYKTVRAQTQAQANVPQYYDYNAWASSGQPYAGSTGRGGVSGNVLIFGGVALLGFYLLTQKKGR
jgi:hypothetical protein